VEPLALEDEGVERRQDADHLLGGIESRFERLGPCPVPGLSRAVEIDRDELFAAHSRLDQSPHGGLAAGIEMAGRIQAHDALRSQRPVEQIVQDGPINRHDTPDQPALLFPPQPAWVVTADPNQSVTFTMDTSQANPSRFIAARHVVGANDSATQFRLVGDFQGWDANDPTALLRQVGSGIYQQVRRLSTPGQYNAYIIASGVADNQTTTAIDGYGRTTAPSPFSFRTLRRDDYVVFRLDLNQGRATILYNMHPLLARLAYDGGYWIVGGVVGAAAFLSALWLLLRSFLLFRHKSWLDAGCPRCHENELMRIERQPIDRFLHALGLPAYRYQCRHCTWQGMRFSVGGLSASPRSNLARVRQE